MTIRRQTDKRGRRKFTVVARGIRRDDPDISRIVKAALDHYRATADQSTHKAIKRSSSSTDGETS